VANPPFHVLVIGAGAAGMFCASRTAQALRSSGCAQPRVALLDHAKVLGEKIRISGGGRCNFTNNHASPANYLSENPHFCRSALAQYTAQDFIALVRKHHISFHEKTLGQLFCDDSSQQIIDLLVNECRDERVEFIHPATLNALSIEADQFIANTDRGHIVAQQVVVSTGGLSIPATGATALGYELAKQFGHSVTALRAGLVPLAMDAQDVERYASLSGLSFEAVASASVAADTKRSKVKRPDFREAVLLTHRGLSGPAILQISNYWAAGGDVLLNLLPSIDAAEWVAALKQSNRNFLNALSEHVPQRFAAAWCASELPASTRDKPIGNWTKQELADIAKALSQWAIKPSGTLGYKKAEVTLGGVDTRELSSQTMMSQKQAGLYFIGEVVDVTGWLGGYNFQWAWASAAAAARGIAERYQS
jgi:predicted Rossmann fold flavoprotein